MKKEPSPRFKIYALLALVSSLLFVQCNLENKKVQQMLEEDAKAMNAQCPKMEDPFTRHDGCQVLPDKVFQYNYTIMVNDSALRPLYETQLIPSIKKNVKTHPVYAAYRKNKVTIRIVYSDTLKNELLKFDVTPKDYE